MHTYSGEQVLDALTNVDQALGQTRDLGFILREVARCMLDAFACERAYLHLLDPVEGGGLFEPIVLSRLPEGETRWQVLDEDEFGRSLLAVARIGEVVRFGPGGTVIPEASRLAALGVRSGILAVFTPRLGPAFVMGVHDCTHGREFNVERRIFVCIGARVADVLAHRVAVQLLRQCEARARVLIEHSSEAIMLLDVGTQRIIDANTRAEQALGSAHGHLLGTELSQVCQESSEKLAEQLAEVVGGEARTFRWKLRRASGGSLECEVELVTVPDSERLLVRARLNVLGPA